MTTRVRKLQARSTQTTGDDWVAAESPLEIRIGGASTTVLMRTPGNDDELVRGFLFTEGIVSSNEDVISIGDPAPSAESMGGSIIEVTLGSGSNIGNMDRSFYSNASCGVCGKTSIASLEVHGAITATPLNVSSSVLGTLPEKLKTSQTTFAKTGGVHASGVFTVHGELLALREDVGRHNALDKIIGWAMSAGKLPLSESVLLVSGRVSYEIVQKAVAGGIPFIAAVGAPSSLAVALAERFNVTLVGFLRPESMNVYAHEERIVE